MMITRSADITLMNTGPIRDIIAHMILAALALLRGGAPLGKTAQKLSHLAALYRLLLVMERYNFDKTLKTKMLADPDWRARVWADLGGWFGAQRWRERDARRYEIRAVNRTQSQASPAATDADFMPERVSGNRYRTDSQGQFRWAAITRGACETASLQVNRDAINTRSGGRIDHPIELYPHDFEYVHVNEDNDVSDCKETDINNIKNYLATLHLKDKDPPEGLYN